MPPAGLIARARIHAALGDPVRLAIVDSLAVGDSSPSALGAALGLPSNLLAHHLGVLVDAAVVVRVRSEGDRRRTYVRLCLDDTVLGLVGAPPPRPPAARVVFVCTHNSARSQLAAAQWRRMSRVPVACAGTRPANRVHPRAVATAAQHGLDLAPAQTAATGDVVRPDDLLVAVCDNAYEEMGGTAVHWAVPDPMRLDTAAAFERAYEEIALRVARLAEATRPLPDPPTRPEGRTPRRPL